MTTEIYSYDISVFGDGGKIVEVLSPNYDFKNNGTATLDVTVKFCLVQHLGLGNETVTLLQSWCRKDIASGQNINVTGVHFISSTNKDLILTEINGDAQTFRMIVEVTGGATEEDRTSLDKMAYTNMDYSKK